MITFFGILDGTAVPVHYGKYMAALNRQQAGAMAKMEEFVTSTLAVLEDPTVMERYRSQVFYQIGIIEGYAGYR